MMQQTNRLPRGGLIDRHKTLRFTFDGKAFTGYEGDTLASALIANGVDILGRSFKYHRPRGILSAGSEEPNALVAVGKGNEHEPNLLATRVMLRDGMTVTSQNRWPSLKFDIGIITRVMSPILIAGFYYKTFMKPRWAWMKYEYIIRRMAGLGVSPDRPDPDSYDKRFMHCDVLVVGAGPAGLMAAKTAAESGARVILCDEDIVPGGTLLGEDISIDGMTGHEWAGKAAEDLAAISDVEVLLNTTVFNHSDHNYLLAISDNSVSTKTRKSLLKIRTKHVILATGAIERPQLFDGNDLPGVMLAGSVRTYINRFGVKPGKSAVIYTNNDSGYETLKALNKAGIAIKAIIDNRQAASQDAIKLATQFDIKVLLSHRLTKARGRGRVNAIYAESVIGDTGHTTGQTIPCDLVCMAGGWTPTVHLFSQIGGKLIFDDKIASLVADSTSHSSHLVGSACCQFDLASCLQADTKATSPVVDQAMLFQTDITSDWAHAVSIKERTKTFVDFQNDVTVADLALAVREGYVHVELAKRYTTTGMGMDQGKTSNVHAIGLLTELTGKRAQDIGHTTFRAPYTPVTFGAVAGREVHENMTPIRRTPFYHCHVNAGVVFEPSSSWEFPKYYPRTGESIDAAIGRETVNTRTNVGVVDMSSLGKLEVCGPDAVKFLELAYINKFAKLPIGRCRYAIMLRNDGLVLDDGTVTRLAEDRFLITMTTAHTWPAQLQIQRMLDIDFPELDVAIASVTEQWASLAIAGPNARKVLEQLNPSFDISNKAFPFLEFRNGFVAGLPVRVYRVSFSGELSYEINVGARDAQALWNAVFEAGKPFDIMPYGLEALDIMRIEKGHLSIGTEIDGKTTPDDLGLGGMVKKDQFFVGSVLLDRPALQKEDRLQLVGLEPVDKRSLIPRGAQILDTRFKGGQVESLGHVSATIYSPTLNQPIALALISGGRARMGEKLYATSPVNNEEVEVTVTCPVFVDQSGERLRV